MKVITFLVIFNIFFFTVTTTAEKWPKWLDVDPSLNSLGEICVSDNDTIGRKLGCDCKYPITTPGRNLVADCSAQTLGTETSELPASINVSIHVRYLIFSDNFIRELTPLTFGSVEGITEANFARNRIESVHGIAFPRLANLDLSHNRLHNLSADAFKNSTKIEIMDLSFNSLYAIDCDTFSDLEYLRKLNLASNLLGVGMEAMDEYTFTIAGNLHRLEELDLSNNSLREFPTELTGVIGALPLKILNLRDNQILHLPNLVFYELENLEMLDLSGNFLSVIHPHNFHGLFHLQTLILDRNNDLIEIEEHAFAGLVKLKELSVQRNHRLTSIHRLAFTGDPSMAEGNESKPTTVRLGDNGLTYLDSDLLHWKELQYLELIRNPWMCDCNLQWVPELKQYKSDEAAILIDPDFQCDSPVHLRGIPVATVDPTELMCSSYTASVVGIIGILVLCIVLITICSVLGLHTLGLMPEKLKSWRVCKPCQSLPKYSRVHPKSDGSIGSIEAGTELEWDTGDIGGYK